MSFWSEAKNLRAGLGLILVSWQLVIFKNPFPVSLFGKACPEFIEGRD
jgi:hypothetical protein